MKINYFLLAFIILSGTIAQLKNLTNRLKVVDMNNETCTLQIDSNGNTLITGSVRKCGYKIIFSGDHAECINFDNKRRQNWFDTLNQALESENLTDLWPFGLNIGYGETARFTTDCNRLISVFRETDGRYERPVHYKTI
jgi:hypothetical protein